MCCSIFGLFITTIKLTSLQELLGGMKVIVTEVDQFDLVVILKVALLLQPWTPLSWRLICSDLQGS